MVSYFCHNYLNKIYLTNFDGEELTKEKEITCKNCSQVFIVFIRR